MTTRSHGCYCKVCGQYKSNESFSGKGHAAHICKVCSKLPAAVKAKRETLNRLAGIAYHNTNAADEKWLRNRLKDERPEVASLAKVAYAQLHPNASRNAMKKVLVIYTCILIRRSRLAELNQPKLNAGRETLIAKTEAKLATRKAALEKSAAQLEKVIAKKARVIEAKEKSMLSAAERAAAKQAAKAEEKLKMSKLMEALKASGKSIEELLEDLTGKDE